jgi:ABC-type lipopolysaccharide export system ATPase subunit
MDIVLYIIVGIVSFAAGRVSAPEKIVKQTALSDREQKEYDYVKNLNTSLLSEVQQLRSTENQLRGQLWETKQKLKKSQQKN